MKAIALIPARYEASRYPGKLLAKLAGRSVILRTYEAVVKTQLFAETYVVTDSDSIENEITKHGGKAIRSKIAHDCGTNRIAEAAQHLDADIVVNVQGDEPFIQKKPLQDLLSVFEKDAKHEIDLASLRQEIHSEKDINNPNVVKVIVDQAMNAMYFSRSPIPYPRSIHKGTKYYVHIGVYAFRKSALIDFYHTAPTPLEDTEKIEGIRYLETGKKIKMVTTDYMGVSIDTPDDLEIAEKIWAKTLINKDANL